MDKSRISEMSDEEVVQEYLRSGEGRWFALLFERYRSKVRGKCLSLTKNTSVAEDLVQDVMVRAMEKLDGFKGKSSFSTWLYSVTYNTCIEYLRQHRRINYSDWEPVLEVPESVDEDDVEDILQLKSRKVNLMLEMLRPEDKAILIARYMDEMSLREMMEVFQVDGTSAMKMRLNRAKARLVALQQKMFPDALE